MTKGEAGFKRVYYRFFAWSRQLAPWSGLAALDELPPFGHDNLGRDVLPASARNRVDEGGKAQHEEQ